MERLSYEEVKRLVPPNSIYFVREDGEVVGLLNVEAFYSLKDVERGLKETFGALPILGKHLFEFLRRDKEVIATQIGGAYVNLLIVDKIPKADKALEEVHNIVNKHLEISSKANELIRIAFSRESENYDKVLSQAITLAKVLIEYSFPEAFKLIEEINDPGHFELYATSRVVTLRKSYEAVEEFIKKGLDEVNSEEEGYEAINSLAKLNEMMLKLTFVHSKKREKIMKERKDKSQVYIV